jgi:hypothetical protein
MGVPGFTAEVSAARTENTYTARPRAVSAGQVIPQQDNAADPCRGACKCCSFYGYDGCCNICDLCFLRH